MTLTKRVAKTITNESRAHVRRGWRHQRSFGRRVAVRCSTCADEPLRHWSASPPETPMPRHRDNDCGQRTSPTRRSACWRGSRHASPVWRRSRQRRRSLPLTTTRTQRQGKWVVLVAQSRPGLETGSERDASPTSEHQLSLVHRTFISAVHRYSLISLSPGFPFPSSPSTPCDT